MEFSMNKRVVIVGFDPEWATLYEEEKELICRTLGQRIRAIEHTGSTAVPNLGGKNIIDIMVGVNDLDEANECLPPLEKIGYTDVTPQPAPDNTQWYYCLGKGHHSPGYHLHLVKFESEHWKKHIIFRDFLRKNPAVVKDYFNLKKQLAAKYGADRIGYTEAKSAFIELAIAKAKRLEHGSSGY
jgi:GrpB-like predicted nucleotidyltransferase (UPF0157 family)